MLAGALVPALPLQHDALVCCRGVRLTVWGQVHTLRQNGTSSVPFCRGVWTWGLCMASLKSLVWVDNFVVRLWSHTCEDHWPLKSGTMPNQDHIYMHISKVTLQSSTSIRCKEMPSSLLSYNTTRHGWRQTSEADSV